MRRARSMSLGMMVALFACIAHSFVSANRATRKLLEREHRGAQEAHVRRVRLRELAHEPLERALAHEEVGALLEMPNLAQSHRARTEAALSQVLRGGGELARLALRACHSQECFHSSCASPSSCAATAGAATLCMGGGPSSSSGTHTW